MHEPPPKPPRFRPIAPPPPIPVAPLEPRVLPGAQKPIEQRLSRSSIISRWSSRYRFASLGLRPIVTVYSVGSSYREAVELGEHELITESSPAHLGGRKGG